MTISGRVPVETLREEYNFFVPWVSGVCVCVCVCVCMCVCMCVCVHMWGECASVRVCLWGRCACGEGVCTVDYCTLLEPLWLVVVLVSMVTVPTLWWVCPQVVVPMERVYGVLFRACEEQLCRSFAMEMWNGEKEGCVTVYVCDCVMCDCVMCDCVMCDCVMCDCVMCDCVMCDCVCVCLCNV